MALTPQQAFAQSLTTKLSREELLEVEKFEQDVDAALLDRFDGLSIVITCTAAPKMLGEIVRRYAIKGWDIEIEITKKPPTDPLTGAPLLGQDQQFSLKLIPNWQLNQVELIGR